MNNRTLVALTLTLALAAAPCAAQEIAVGPDRYALTLRGMDLHPATPEAARRSLARIDRAAMAVCGASDTSLAEVRRAVRHAACWRDSMADALQRIDDPLLAHLWHDHR